MSSPREPLQDTVSNSAETTRYAENARRDIWGRSDWLSATTPHILEDAVSGPIDATREGTPLYDDAISIWLRNQHGAGFYNIPAIPVGGPTVTVSLTNLSLASSHN